MNEAQIDEFDKNINIFNEQNYKKIKHKSGLTIILNLMPKYNSSFAIIGVRYGSMNIEFKKPKDKDFISVPPGTAHFLEHKMFENSDGEDTFAKFAKTGAIANAQTGYNETAFLFSSSENFEESLKILLKYVTHPYFTNKNVDKEKDIICQEIKMYQDDPEWRCYFEVIRGLYSKIPIIYDNAGTKESINKITKEILYQCYDMYYKLNNMVLSIAGNFDVNESIKVIDKVLAKIVSDEPFDVINKTYNEPEEIYRRKKIVYLPIDIPMLGVGFKHTPAKTLRDNFILEMRYSIINELLTGSISELYSDLYYKGIIEKPISYEIIHGQGYLASIFIVETNDVNIVKQKLLEAISEIKLNGISVSDFIAVKKDFYGRHIMDMDDLEKVATKHMEGDLSDFDFKDWEKELLKIKREELEELINNEYTYEKLSTAIILPFVN